jgi:hypothetical protein
MMKYTGTLALGMGVLLGVPAFTLGGGLPGSLKDALNDTVRAIDVLNQLEERMGTGEAIPVDAVKKLTEVAILDPRGRDELLETLRNEVGSLQNKVDVAEASVAPPLAEIDPLNGTSAYGPEYSQPSVTETVEDTSTGNFDGLNIAGVSTGMSTTLRTSIAVGSGSSNGGRSAFAPGETGPVATYPLPTETGTETGAVDEARSSNSTATETGPKISTTDSTNKKPTPAPAAQSPEGKGYSANPLLQAKACYRAKRYQQGLDLLVGASKSAEVTFWKARLEDKLGNLDEAIRLYTLLKDDMAAGEYAAKAESELEFLVWRRDYETKGDSK